MLRSSSRALAAATLLLMSGLSPVAAQQGERSGENEYLAACAACHGPSGKGDGPVAQYLNVRPPDLSQLTRRSDGQFPFYKVFQLVDGRTLGGVHGSRAMPIWGQRFAAEASDRYGPFGAETIIRGRIVDLVRYVETLQQ